MVLRFTLTCCLQGLRIKPLTFWSLKIIWITAPLVAAPQRTLASVPGSCQLEERPSNPTLSANHCAGVHRITFFQRLGLAAHQSLLAFYGMPGNAAFGLEEQWSFNVLHWWHCDSSGWGCQHLWIQGWAILTCARRFGTPAKRFSSSDFWMVRPQIIQLWN